MAWRRAVWDSDGWREWAACQEAEPAIFFASGSAPEAIEATSSAKAMCACCPVAEECLVFAVTTNQDHGVWGGLDEEERREVRRAWRRASRRAGSATRVAS